MGTTEGFRKFPNLGFIVRQSMFFLVGASFGDRFCQAVALKIAQEILQVWTQDHQHVASSGANAPADHSIGSLGLSAIRHHFWTALVSLVLQPLPSDQTAFGGSTVYIPFEKV